MKKQFGVSMNENIENNDDAKQELTNNIFEKLKSAFIDQERLMSRFVLFCINYRDFEYDEMGMNMDESEDIIRKANKICTKLLINIQSELVYTFNNININIVSNSFCFELTKEDYQFVITVEVLKDSFNINIIDKI